MSKDLTPWFPPEIKPVHKGVYEMEPGQDEILGGSLGPFQKWNGTEWLEYTSSVDRADDSTEASLHQNRKWRGLVENPE